MATDQVDQLAEVLDATGQLISAVRDDHWNAPTPCPEWTVRDLVSHVVRGNYLFAGILAGLPPVAPPDSSLPPAELVISYRDSARDLLAAFRQPGVLDRVFTVPFGTVPGNVALHLRITEVLVHGWDIARATDQRAEFPDDIVEAELAFSHGLLPQIPPGRHPFAPSHPVADDAPAIDRLAACLGRQVS
jgi:uncharacterized protein (TIGR03086 family)